MRTAEEKAEYWLKDNVAGWGDIEFRTLITLLKEQDRDTRLACTEAVTNCPGASYGDADVIWRSDAERACMNTKAV